MQDVIGAARPTIGGTRATWWLLPALVLGYNLGCNDKAPAKTDSGAALDSVPDTTTTGDGDGDGYPSTASGGTDCDDSNPTINPGAFETWYDGFDQDCDGWSDFDQDHDGDDSDDFGGGDCADGDPNINSSTPETHDGTDEDCDGLIDEDFINLGEVIITEVMHDPLDVLDADGEWIEILNVGTEDLDMFGWVIRTEAGDFTIQSSTPLPAGNPVVMTGTLDPLLNGLPDPNSEVENGTLAALGLGDFGMSDRGYVEIYAGETLLTSLDWSDPSWPSEPGRSLMVDAAHATLTDAGDVTWWCLADSVYGPTDRGTPRFANGDCPNLDHDGDGFSPDDGDCDDYGPTVNPDGVETWDGRDQDCNGVVDDLAIEIDARAVLDGVAGERLGVTLGLGELTADAMLDVVVGSRAGAGAAYAVNGGLLRGATGAITTSAQVTVTGRDGDAAFGAFSSQFADVTGDGAGDLVIAGAVTSSPDEPAVSVYQGGAFFYGNFGEGDGVINITGVVGASAQRVHSGLDFDGDGVATLLVADPLDGAGVVYGLELGGRAGTLDLSDDAAFILTGDVAGDAMGLGLGGGDLDGDGVPELFLGAPSADAVTGPDAGTWSVLSGATLGSGTASAQAGLRVVSATGADAVGWGEPVIYDLDGNGAQDLAFGTFAAGKVYVFLDAGTLLGGATVDPDLDADLILSGGGSFGFALGAGDLEADGLPELYVGMPAHAGTDPLADWSDTDGLATGELRVYQALALLGGASIDDSTLRYLGESPGDLFGAVITAPTTLDGGGDDLMISAPRVGGDAGRVYVVSGAP